MELQIEQKILGDDHRHEIGRQYPKFLFDKGIIEQVDISQDKVEGEGLYYQRVLTSALEPMILPVDRPHADDIIDDPENNDYHCVGNTSQCRIHSFVEGCQVLVGRYVIIKSGEEDEIGKDEAEGQHEKRDVGDPFPCPLGESVL